MKYLKKKKKKKTLKKGICVRCFPECPPVSLSISNPRKSFSIDWGSIGYRLGFWFENLWKMESILSADKQSMVSSFLEIAVGQSADTARQFLQVTLGSHLSSFLRFNCCFFVTLCRNYGLLLMGFGLLSYI